MFEVLERFSSEDNLHKHYVKHVIKGKEFGKITEQEYEKLAEDLQNSDVDYKNILGYISDYNGNISYNKYDKNTGVFVAYYYVNSKPLTITCYIKTLRRYNEDKATNYIDEISKGK